MFDPDSIKPQKLNALRHAAEQAWGDDTRHERFIGHPADCMGQCFVTSQWMTKHLGGHVGQKDGHFFWVSPDKRYGVDLTGDRFAYPPVHPNHQFTEDADGKHDVDPEHKTWRAGPIVYKTTDHPLFQGFRVINDNSDHPRAKQFARRADLALHGKRVSSVHVADLMGPSGFSTPQQEEDYAMGGQPFPMLHDEPGHDPAHQPVQEYKWVFANGQLHVSPVHNHEDLIDHAGESPATDGPIAVGYVTVNQGRALWEVETNVSLRGLHQVLQQYSDTVGWKFDGMVGTDGGPLHDDFGPKKAMWFTYRKDGHLLMSERPLPEAQRLTIQGKTAFTSESTPALEEWATDFGYKLAMEMHPFVQAFTDLVAQDHPPEDGYSPPEAEPVDERRWQVTQRPGAYSEEGTHPKTWTVWPHTGVIERWSPYEEQPSRDLGMMNRMQQRMGRTAEYPGGGDMHDKMKTKENLDQFNRGDTDFQPERNNPDQKPEGNLECGHCGLPFDDLEQLRVHERYDHRDKDYREIEDGHFPQIDDFDAPLPLRRRQPLPGDQGLGFATARTAVMVLPSFRLAQRHPRFDLYAGLFGYNNDDGHQFYGAYRDGQLVGYATVRLNRENKPRTTNREPELVMIDAVQSGAGVGTALLSLVQRHFASFYTHADSEGGERLMSRCGMVNVEGRRWRWSKGDHPKDMIEAAIPFVYDYMQDHVEIGFPGQRTHDIEPRNLDRFSPGGIVEGYYEPGGKIVLIPASNLPYTTRAFAQAWYNRFPQMEITKLEEEQPNGNTVKIAAENVGNYVRRILPSDPAAYAAYHALRDAGGKVYAVGGVVRDALQGREPADIDLMVGGMPAEQIEHALEAIGRVDYAGKNFGVYHVTIKGGDHVEVALPRQDKYEESQRAKGVITADPNLPVEKDLERRDFTANSMAVDLDNGELIDPYGGANDSQNYILRTTHPDAFREDPTRLVRALAMHGRFGLNPDEKTRHEMESNGHLLRGESPDAINKILTEKVFGPKNGNPAGSMRLASETGMLQHLYPNAHQHWDYDQNNPHHNYPLGEHHLHVLDNVSRINSDPDVRMAAWYHDWGKPASMTVNPETGYSRYYEIVEPGVDPLTGQPDPNLPKQVSGADHAVVGAHMAESDMRDKNYSTAHIQRVSDLVRHHMFGAFNSPKGARKFLQRVGGHADDLLDLRQADMAGKGVTPEEQAAEQSVNRMRQLVDESRREQAPTDLSNLQINGNDLISLGIKPGPAIGQILRQLLDDVVEQPTMNNREALLARAQQYANAQPA